MVLFKIKESKSGKSPFCGICYDFTCLRHLEGDGEKLVSYIPNILGGNENVWSAEGDILGEVNLGRAWSLASNLNQSISQLNIIELLS